MPVKYNDFVKKPFSEHEYTNEQIYSLKKCSENVFEFLKYIKIVHPDKGRIIFKPWKFQKKIINTVKKNRNTIILCSRQVGKTVTVSAFALWYALFNNDKTIGIVSNKEKSAISILSKIKIMYEELPAWIKPGVGEYPKTSIDFDNGTKIMVSTTSSDAFRGETLNILICEEFSFVPRFIATDFWAANYPTISASKEAKIIIISTPSGVFNPFHNLYTGAINKTNTFVPLKFTWRCVPGRDQKWADEQLANMGKTKFLQEHEVNFIGSVHTVINEDILKNIMSSTKEPMLIELENKFRIYEKPKKDTLYILGVDTAKGTGEHFSTIQVLEVDKIKPITMKQVAVYESNTTDIFTFSGIVNRTSIYYNNAYIMVENNAEGSAVVNQLWWVLENQNLVNSGGKTVDLGVRATRSSKQRAVILMKKLIEDGSLKIIDEKTVNQLSSFIEKNGKFSGKDYPDDLVSALYWACYFFEMGYLEEDYELKKEDKKEEVWGILSDLEPEPDYFSNTPLWD